MPFYATEASSFRPNDPTHEFASSKTGRTPDPLLASEFERSEYVQERWTDCQDDALWGQGNVQHFAPLVNSEGDWCGQSLNPPEYIDPSLLTLLEHEPRNYFPSGVSQYIEENPVQTSSQFPVDPPSEIQQILPRLPLDQSNQDWESSPAHDSPPTLTDSTTTTTSSPRSDGQIFNDPPDGKMEIVAAHSNLVCSMCHQVFPSALRYRKHVSVTSCQKAFDCQDCGRKFNKAKDLRRHRGPDETTSTCLKPRSGGLKPKPFACTCQAKSYTRKDSLLRHLHEYAHEQPLRHRCKGCDQYPCGCVGQK